MNKKIPVTEPFLPPLDEYIGHLKGIWDRGHVTNQGPLVGKLQETIQSSQNIAQPVLCMSSGGMALQVLLKAMGIGGEVITTPYSYIATASCPAWEGCSIKFADIESDFLTIDPDAVADAITPSTEAIIATHLYGNPCDCEALDSIAAKHGIALIYDAAHAYGVRYKDESILSFGDASMVSLHATKIFHTIEGGFVVAKDSAVSEKVEWMRRFGHDGLEKYHGLGVNAKMSELHAAVGLCVHEHFGAIVDSRRAACEIYDHGIEGIDGVKRAFQLRNQTEWNFAYYPLSFASEESLLRAVELLEAEGVSPRRYFYPAIHQAGLSGLAAECPIASKISRETLCLPLAASTSNSDAEKIIDILKSNCP